MPCFILFSQVFEDLPSHARCNSRKKPPSFVSVDAGAIAISEFVYAPVVASEATHPHVLTIDLIIQFDNFDSRSGRLVCTVCMCRRCELSESNLLHCSQSPLLVHLFCKESNHQNVGPDLSSSAALGSEFIYPLPLNPYCRAEKSTAANLLPFCRQRRSRRGH